DAVETKPSLRSECLRVFNQLQHRALCAVHDVVSGPASVEDQKIEYVHQPNLRLQRTSAGERAVVFESLRFRDGIGILQLQSTLQAVESTGHGRRHEIESEQP